MTVVVYLIGALLVLAGAVFISMGVPIVRLEIGWSEIIGGAVAGSAGFVVLALGVVVSRLEELRRTVLGLNVASALRDGFVAADPEPEPAWAAERPAGRPFTPHPLAPPIQPAAAEPVPVAPPQQLEPIDVEPEPPLAEAPLHPDEAEQPVAFEALRPTVDPAPAPELTEGAPALQPDEDHAPPLPPVEALPADSLNETPLVPPPERPPETERTRPNFLASFLARRSAASSLVQRMTPPREREASVEPPLTPLRSLEAGPSPARTSVDLSSGWDEEPEPPHHMPSGLADEPVPAPEPVPPEEPQPHPEIVAPVPEPVEPSAVAPEPPAATEPLKPVVVGRYNAGSASYIMYSDGMIEVETDSGTHQFASMQELKAFIERRDAAKV